ncbi:MAG: SsrA-binding protein SmpB [Chloroflexi bacterium]|nr:SsrA-binding protein SmpB [Chloroflexota bacterium]
MTQTTPSQIKIVARNRRARYEYEILETYQAGLVLLGSEIKSIRDHRVSLGDGFVNERNDELWLLNVHIALYEQARQYGHSDPLRPRKLLLHKREIARIIQRIRERGMTVIPTLMYLQRSRAKVEIAVSRGKRRYDKRQAIAERESRRQLQRALKGGQRGSFTSLE